MILRRGKCSSDVHIVIVSGELHRKNWLVTQMETRCYGLYWIGYIGIKLRFKVSSSPLHSSENSNAFQCSAFSDNLTFKYSVKGIEITTPHIFGILLKVKMTGRQFRHILHGANPSSSSFPTATKECIQANPTTEARWARVKQKTDPFAGWVLRLSWSSWDYDDKRGSRRLPENHYHKLW